MAIPHYRYSFDKGIKLLKVKDAKKVKDELLEYLKCTARSEFSRKRHGYNDIPHHVYVRITRIIAKYGVPEKDIWDIEKIRK
jgi:hypothetical protein